LTKMMAALADLVLQTRSCRRFDESVKISQAELRNLLELARLGGSARNAQPLKYLAACTPALNDKIFPHLAWAGYLPEWPGPTAGERPTGYIVCLLDTRIANNGDIDLGIASQNILLGASAMGLAGCRIASVAAKLHTELGLAAHLKIMLVIALGKAKETVVLEEITPAGDIKYWRDEKQIHHVPKRALADIIITPTP